MHPPRPTPLRLSVLAVAALATLAPGPDRLEAQTGNVDSTFIRALDWRNVGPLRGGRSQAVAGSEARPLEYYFGATGGGLWKTVDGGTTWRSVSDETFTSSSVGAVDVCPANPDIVFVGMGETQLRGNIQQGDGIYRSDDGGETWQHVGLAETQAVARVRIHPWNCDRVFVAALGHPYGPNPERGVYRTTDGGESWEKVLYRNDRVGAVDLDLDPDDPTVMYAGFWEVDRSPWGLTSGGDGGGLFRSEDGGETWTEITHNEGLPEDPIGKIGVSAAPGSDRVYAIIEAEEGGVFRSEDAGATWERVNDERRLRQRAFYYTRIYADPVDPDRVYVLNTGFYRSTDAGETYSRVRVPHGDNHDLWIAPDDPERMINSNDGGANVSFNGGRTWTEQDYATAQFYHVTTTSHFPYHICGAQQDNSTACVPFRGWRHLSARGPNHGYYYGVGGGESGYIAPHPEDPDIFYAGSYGGYLSRYDHGTGESRNIQVWPVNPMGHSSEDIRERFQWTFPIVFSPHDPDVVYTASQRVWKTMDGGESWEPISPDLSRADPKTMGPSGGPITKDQTGVETYATVFTLAPSPHDPQVIWAGSDDGLVHVTRDGGATWDEVTPEGLPEFTRISLIATSPHTPGKAYLAGNRYQLDDRAPYAYRTDDFGASWTAISAGIPEGHFTRVIREDPVRPGLLFAGTEHGVHLSFDDGGHWQPLNHGLPDVQVADLVVEDHDLVIGTHGRSFWVMEDLGLYRELDPEVTDADLHLFDPRDAYRDIDRAVTVRYALKEAADTVHVEFVDDSGEVIRAYTGFAVDTSEAADEEEDDGEEIDTDTIPPVGAGVNEFRWNLRHPGPTTFEGMIFWAAPTSLGPRVPPGDYTVRVRADGLRAERSFEVKLDPRLEGIAVADVEEQYELAKRIWRRTSEANEAVIRIREVAGAIESRVDDAGDAGEVRSVGRSVLGELDEVENAIYQTRLESNQDPLNFPIKLNNKIAYLLRVVESTPDRPTRSAREAFDSLSGRLEAQLEKLREILREDVPRLNEALDEAGMEPVEIAGDVTGGV